MQLEVRGLSEELQARIHALWREPEGVFFAEVFLATATIEGDVVQISTANRFNALQTEILE